MATEYRSHPLLARPVQITLGGARYWVQPGSALDWIEALDRDPRPAALEFLGEEREGVVIRMAMGEIQMDDVQRQTFAVLKELTGEAWWWALRLVAMSGSVSFLGELTLRGVDPASVSLAQWCSAVYRILTREADTKERMKIDFELDVPPPGYEDAWDDDDEYYRAMVASAQKMTR